MFRHNFPRFSRENPIQFFCEADHESVEKFCVFPKLVEMYMERENSFGSLPSLKLQKSTEYPQASRQLSWGIFFQVFWQARS